MCMRKSWEFVTQHVHMYHIWGVSSFQSICNLFTGPASGARVGQTEEQQSLTQSEYSARNLFCSWNSPMKVSNLRTLRTGSNSDRVPWKSPGKLWVKWPAELVLWWWCPSQVYISRNQYVCLICFQRDMPHWNKPWQWRQWVTHPAVMAGCIRQRKGVSHHAKMVMRLLEYSYVFWWAHGALTSFISETGFSQEAVALFHSLKQRIKLTAVFVF